MAPSQGGPKTYAVAGCLCILSAILLPASGTVIDDQSSGLCVVFEPFKVSPDNAQFQIGGPFPLHEPDCIFLKSDSVQELVAVQWALTHWNQNPDNHRSKLAMHAGDTCSRPLQAVAMTLEFMATTGVFDPAECRTAEHNTRPQMLGYLSPRDFESAERVSHLLKQTSMPISAYTAASVLAYERHNADTNIVISAAPVLSQYMQTVTTLLDSYGLNLVNVVVPADLAEAALPHIRQAFAKAHVTIERVWLEHERSLDTQLAASAGNVTVSFLSTASLHRLLQSHHIQQQASLWINVGLDGASVGSAGLARLLRADAQLRLVVVQRQTEEFDHFKQYFTGVVKNNYPSYSLLATYMQQVHNCTLVGTAGYTDCAAVSEQYMAAEFSQAANVEAVVLATYALATLANQLQHSQEYTQACSQPGISCMRAMRAILSGLEYDFDQYDPQAFERFALAFDELEENVFVARNVLIEAQLVRVQVRLGVTVAQLVRHSTGSSPMLLPDGLNAPALDVASRCDVSVPACQRCPPENTHQPDTDVTLSLPAKPYDSYLLGVFDLSDDADGKEPSTSPTALLYPLAFVHTLHTLNQRYTHLRLDSLGALVMDSRSSTRRTAAALATLVDPAACTQIGVDAVRNVTLHGGQVVGAAVSSASAGVQRAVGVVADQLMVVSAAARRPDTQGMLFSLLPATEGRMRALILLLKQYDWTWVSAVVTTTDCASCLHDFKLFKRLIADEADLCIADQVYLSSVVPSSLRPMAPVVLLFTSEQHTAEAAGRLNTDTQLVLASQQAHHWRLHNFGGVTPPALYGAISLQLKHQVRADFVSWLNEISPENLPERWFVRFYESYFRCATAPSRVAAFGGKRCSGLDRVGLQQFEPAMAGVGYWIEAVEALAFAVDGANRQLCPDNQPFCAAFKVDGATMIESTLAKVSRRPEYELWTFTPEADGSHVYKLFGNSTDEELHTVAEHTAYDGHGRPASRVQSQCRAPLCKCKLDKDFFSQPLQSHTVAGEGSIADTTVSVRQANQGAPAVTNASVMWLQPRVDWGHWVYLLLAVITSLLLLAVAVLLLVCVKLYKRVVKGNQSLGICLLVSVILLYGTAYLFVFDASEPVCTGRYVAHSLAYVLCFATMIAKATQLRNRETLGVNGPHISYWNYWLLLVFIVGVQLALHLQWLLSDNRMPTFSAATGSCAWSPIAFVFSQCYVCLLLLVVLFVSVLNRNVKRNYKETRWLLSSALLCVPIWVAWIAAYLLLSSVLHDMIVVVELICCATIVLCFMFGPKVYILLRYEPVLLEFPAGYKLRDDAGGEADQQKAPNFYGTTFDFYEKDFADYSDEAGAMRATSPASSSGASTRSTNVSQTGDSTPRSASSTLQAVVRKKSRSKRLKARPPIAGSQSPMAGPLVGGGVGHLTAVHRSTSHDRHVPSAVIYGIRSSH